MTYRLPIIVAIGAAAIVAAAAGALLVLRGPAEPPSASPTWGLFDDTEWRSITSRLPTFHTGTLHVLAATSKRLALVGDDRGCVALVRAGHVSAPICTVTKPVVAFAMRHGRSVDVVGLASARVSTVVIVEGGRREGVALLPAGSFDVFGFSSPAAPVLETLDDAGNVASKLYCASDFRGVCGISAQRRS